MILFLILLIALGTYFVMDAVMLFKDGQLSLSRSRTWSIAIALLLIAKMIWDYFIGDFNFDSSVGMSGREYFIFGMIVLATVYTFLDFVRALLKKDAYLSDSTHPDKKCNSHVAFIRRKFTFFMFMAVVMLFYLELKV